MDTDSGIPVGKGTISISGDVRKFIRGKMYILLVRHSRPGPCNDEMCRQIDEVHISASDTVPDDFRIVAAGGFYLGFHPDVFTGIDRNREKIVLKFSFSGKANLKGFYF
ncbi:MAG: hypothetical protein M1431_08390 [Candidatus Thermoplasmatota archaeon]|nr:hypothetical protein [Candidatus Thermoplasmatota archaeon]